MKPLARALTWVPSLYFAEGLPYVAVMTVAVIMYKSLGIGNVEIAFFTSWLYLPWVVKPLWSPFVDMFSTKRRWIVLMQWAIAASLASIAFLLSTDAFFAWTLAMFWLMAFLSATHDIAADGFYMLGLPEKEQSLLVGVRTLFYRLAMIAGQGGVVIVAGIMAQSHGEQRGWQVAMALLSALFVLLASWHLFALPRPQTDRPDLAKKSVRDIFREFWLTLTTFFGKRGIGVALLFMLLYRFPEAQLVKLISPFLLDGHEAGGMALSEQAVGVAYGTVGVTALILGGIVGGWLVSVWGLRRALMPMALSMSLTCLTFVYLAFVPGSPLWMVNLCVAVEQLGYGFGTTAYTLYLINFSKGERATSHYALCTGVMALGMMLPGMAAGWLQELMGYRLFFIYTMVCCLLTIAVTFAARRGVSRYSGE